MKSNIFKVLGPVLFVIILILCQSIGIDHGKSIVLAMAAWMLVWWISETISLGITALLPLLILPVFDVLPIKEVSTNFGSHIIFLFMGGFFLARAIEKVNLHKRIALIIIRAVGVDPKRSILGMMVATAFLSMWISNTATTVMMLPMATSLIALLKHDIGDTKDFRNYSAVMCMGIAYAANIGGIGTIIGTPPNAVLSSFLSSTYGYEIDFITWMIFATPLAIAILAITYIFLIKKYSFNIEVNSLKQKVNQEYQSLGKITFEEKWVLSFFALAAFLWIGKPLINSGLRIKLNDVSSIMFVSLCLFAIPVGKAKPILEKKDISSVPWNILLLFGGGIALASSLAKVGIMNDVAMFVRAYTDYDSMIIVALICTVSLFLTEVMSNVALASVMIPVMSALAIGIGENPLIIIISLTLCTSFAFMLPMSTPPNAIVFSAGYLHIKQMMKSGFVLNIVSLIILLIAVKFILPAIFGLEFGVIPEIFQSTS